MAFGEGVFYEPIVPCTLADSWRGVAGNLALCFGTDRQVWSQGDPIGSLGTGKAGRSDLWSAVHEAWQFLSAVDESEVASKHIVVITDGPDTCDMDLITFGGCGQTPCGVAGFADFQWLAEADEGIHLHFVQFESLGYRGRDPLQVRLACMTAGTHQFIDSETMPREDPALYDAMVAALDGVRQVLQGRWRYALPVEALGSSRGTMVGLTGQVGAVGTDVEAAFGVDVDFGDGTPPVAWDRRPSVVISCGDDSACTETSSECVVGCSQRTGLCHDTVRPSQVPCPLATGATGFCCDGACQEAALKCDACQY